MQGRRKQRIMRGSLLAVLLVLLLAGFHGQKAEAAYRAKGIDVSKWQGSVNWKKVKNDGIEFVMLGLGRYQNGVAQPDPNFKTNIKNALAQNIKVGVYLYSKAVTEEQAREEADYVLDQIDGYKISYPVAFDMEDTVHLKLTTKQRTDIAIAFLEVIEEAGYHPMIYASESWFNSQMDVSRLTKYDKWVARWASSVSFKPISMWQYSSTGRVSGISGDVDLNYSYKNYGKLITPRTKAAKRREKSGWQTDGTHYWYVLKGKMLKKTFKTIDGKRYYFDSKGYRATGWKKLGGKYYYFDKKTGAMKKGWLTVGGKKYYLNSKTGARKTGWQKISGKTYYFDTKTGVMKKGWLKLDGKKYYLNSKGVLQYGMKKISGKTYYFSTRTGRMRTGWLKISGSYYYFSTQTGAMRKGWITISGKKYYLNSDGTRASRWKKLGGKWYYFGPKTGVMLKNTRMGKYRFNARGVCVNYGK